MRAHLLISGRVQGVFYRYSTTEKARALGLSGWVRNLPDGRVEAVAEGPEAAIDHLVGWCHEGPAHARVDSVEVRRGDPVEGIDGFQTRHGPA